MKEYIFAFFVGGTVTVIITAFESSGYSTISRLAALFPVFTWVSYLFIDKLAGGKTVSQHALFVLLGTIFAWIPYMLTIYLLAPKVGASKAVFIALIVFVILALIFTRIYKN